jgi:cysteine sulfinate desulfinase/cysteine desulfurase-like protein
MKPDAGAARQMIRFSLGTNTTQADVEAAISTVKQATAALRN